MTSKTKDITTLGICVSLAIAGGFALLQVPNVELITTISFLSGLLLGWARGLLVGSLSMFIFSLFNPMGIPFPPVLIAQVLFMGLSGFSGGLWRQWIGGATVHPVIIAGLGGTGLLLTLLYDVGTNIGFALSAGLMSRIIPIVGAGIAFSFIHIVTNTLLFASLVPAVVTVMKHHTGLLPLSGPEETDDTNRSYVDINNTNA